MIVKFKNFNVNDYNNFNLTFTNNIKFKRKDVDEILEISYIENKNTYYNIKGIENIKKLYKYINNDIEFERIDIENEEIINDITKYDYDYEMIKYDEKKTKTKLNLEADKLKLYKYYKDIEFENEDVIIKSRIMKEIDSYKNNLKETQLFKEKETYMFEAYIKKENKIENIIKEIIFGINGNIMSLTKDEQKEVLKKYKKTISILFGEKIKFQEDEIVLITPKPITLERINILNKDELGIITIANNYAVTEKADGERYLLYIDDEGKGYLINNSKEVRGTTLKNEEYKNSLYDGELILCNNRKDKANKDLFAIFDIYIKNDKNMTKLPLIDEKKENRYNEMLKITMKSDTHDFIVKEQLISTKDKNIFEVCDDILINAENGQKYKYAIDGLVFTPTKLSVLATYPNIPIKFNKNMKWDKVFKWKPPEQNTIDFIIQETGKIKNYGSNKFYKEYSLMVGYDKKNMEEYDVLKGLEVRYSKEKLQEIFDREKMNEYELKQLVINEKYQYVHIEINDDGNCYTNETNELIENNSVIEFAYDNTISNLSNERKWIPQRTRIDKNRLYNYGKGTINKTANDWNVAMNIWRSITKPITMNMIKGKDMIDINIELENELTSEDIYYNKTGRNEKGISANMTTFHNLIIKDMLYEYPLLNEKTQKRGDLLELACGQGGDLNRWNIHNYSRVVGIDYVKDNITNPINGVYKRYIDKYRYSKREDKEKIPEMLFLIGDCGKNIKNGSSADDLDKDSKKIMQIIFSDKRITENKYNYPIIEKRFRKGFDVVSCMFSIHYFFNNENLLNGFLDNVKDNLKIGGSFICTFMDSNEVNKILIDNIITGVDEKSQSVIWAIKKDLKTKGKYGNKINVFIENTGRFIPENLVDFETLLSKCKEKGLELEKSELFKNTYNEKIDIVKGDLLDILKNMDDNLKKFSFLNRWCVFKRVKLI
jgi:hypothetical protein